MNLDGETLLKGSLLWHSLSEANMEQSNMTAVLSFLEGKGTDHRGRSLKSIQSESDQCWSEEHDFIQWLFPLAEESLSVPGSPTLTPKAIDALRFSVAAKTSIVGSGDWYTAFLSRKSHWKAKYDHNHLRITRAIKALRLLVSEDEANRFRDGVFALLGDDADLIDEKARSFWLTA